jgi:hypothetical protein
MLRADIPLRADQDHSPVRWSPADALKESPSCAENPEAHDPIRAGLANSALRDMNKPAPQPEAKQ